MKRNTEFRLACKTKGIWTYIMGIPQFSSNCFFYWTTEKISQDLLHNLEERLYCISVGTTGILEWSETQLAMANRK